MQLEEEGCLSVPGFNATVVRPTRAVVKGLDRHGARADDRGHATCSRARFSTRWIISTARVFVDRLRGIKRDLIVRKIQKLKTHRQMVTRSGAARSSSSARRRSRCRRSSACSPRRHAVVAVVSQPDRPKGRGQQLVDDADEGRSRSRAESRCCSRERLRGRGVPRAVARLATPTSASSPPTGGSCPTRCCDPAPGDDQRARVAPAAYRGAAPVHRAVIAGDAETGVTIMRVVKELDAGAMFATVRRGRSAGRDQRRGRARPRRARRRRCCSTSSTQLADGRAVETPQDDARATYAAKIDEGRGRGRLDAAGGADSQPGPRPAALAARRPRVLGGARVLDPSHRARRTSSRADGRARHRRRAERRRSATSSAGDGRVVRILEHPARGAPRDDGARVPRRPARRPRARRSRTRMIAPGAHRRVRGPARGRRRARGPAARRSRAPAPRSPDERDRALAGEIATGTLALAGRLRRIDRGVRRAGRSRSSIPRSSTSFA